MYASRFSILTTALLLLALQGCATSTTSTSGAADTGSPTQVEPAPAEDTPELTLNLPHQPAVECLPAEVDYTFLDKGFRALASGDHVEAVTYFQRYQRLESSAAADWEAGIAIAFDSMLPQSPFYDPVAAGNTYRELADRRPLGFALHPTVLAMNAALQTLADMQQQVSELQSDKALLAEDLEKREAAIKRLRELTLGQKAAPP